MKVSRLVVLCTVVPLVAFAQGIEVTGKDGKKVKVGTTGGANVKVESGGKNVNVTNTGTGVQVDSSGKSVNVTTGGGTKVESGGKKVEVNTGGSVAVTPEGEHDDDGAFEIDGVSRQVTHVCTANQDVEINGQGHTVTLSGPCRKVEVNGQGHTVTTDVAETIEVNGMGNKASWKAGLKGPKPKLSIAGMNNTAPQVK